MFKVPLRLFSLCSLSASQMLHVRLKEVNRVHVIWKGTFSRATLNSKPAVLY